MTSLSAGFALGFTFALVLGAVTVAVCIVGTMGDDPNDELHE